jgi:hypothetical protein
MSDYNAPLIFAPLAAYFYALGLLNTGRRPKLVDGRTDFLLLASGLSGLIVFGPLGLSWVQPRIGQVDPLQVLRLLILYAIVALLWSSRYARRVVVYNVDPDRVRAALESRAEGTDFRESFRGLEDATNRRGIAVEPSPRTHSATVDFAGNWDEAAIQEWKEGLKVALEAMPQARPKSWFPYLLFAASCATMVSPLAALLITQPRARAAFWMLFRQIQGG